MFLRPRAEFCRVPEHTPKSPKGAYTTEAVRRNGKSTSSEWVVTGAGARLMAGRARELLQAGGERSAVLLDWQFRWLAGDGGFGKH